MQEYGICKNIFLSWIAFGNLAIGFKFGPREVRQWSLFARISPYEGVGLSCVMWYASVFSELVFLYVSPQAGRSHISTQNRKSLAAACR